MAIGRLDEPSEGLLLLTTDGKVSEHIRSNKVEKEYYVQVDGIIDAQAVEKLSDGVEINTNSGKYLTQSCSVKMLLAPVSLPPRKKKIRDVRHGPTSWISITLAEGKFRQVRKMTAAVDFPTLRLIRIRIGEIKLWEMFPKDVINVPSLVT
jgi:23S rRNA pseudouridine2457 synthase